MTLRERLARQPRFALAHLPTPFEPLRETLHGRRVFVKRDDATGLALGGNKARKLEFTLGDALAKGATALVTASGVQSNHVRQTAAAASRAGLEFHGVLTPALDRFPRAHLDSGNVLLDLLLGAKLYVAADEAAATAQIDAICRDVTARGGKPYVIPLGASDGIGSLGYVGCALELLEQARGLETVFVPTGSGGTHAGLLAGLRLAGSSANVIGISVSEPAAVKRQRVRASLDGIWQVLGLDVPPLEDDEIVVHDAYAGAGYAHPTEAANRAVAMLARREGLLLDPVYTGKAFAGMDDLLAKSPGEGDVVFLHTGGTPALFADPRLLTRIERDAPALQQLEAQVIA